MPETTQNLLPGQIIHLRNVLEEIAKLESVIADPNPPPYSKEDPIYRMENTTTEKNSFHNPYLKPDLPRFEQEAEDESKEEPYLPMKGTALPCYGKMNTLPHGQGLYAMAIDDDDDAPPVPPRSEDEYTVMYPQEKHASHSSCNLHIHQTQLSPSINKRNLTEENLYKRNPTHVFNIGHKTLSYVKFPPKVPSRRRIHSSSELMSVQGFRNDHSLMLDSREEFEKKEESPNVTKFPHRVLARSKSQDLLDLSSHDFPLGQLLEKDLPTPNIAKWLIDRPTNRTEAEAILQNNQEFGNLIVRRREMHGKEKYAVSVGPLHSQKLFKHFVIREESNECATEYFIILGDKTPPKLPSLESVVEYFVKESFGRYKPLQNMATENEHIYDTKISE